MADAKDGGQPEAVMPFHYIKSNYFRVIRVDGVLGGVNPRGVLQASLYSERIPIPQLSFHKLSPEGNLGAEIPERRVTRDGMVREVEVELMLDLAVAKGFAEWILGHLKNVESSTAETKS